MEFYFSAAYYVSIMYRLLFRCASIFSARSFETKAGHARGTAESLFDVLATVLVFRLRVREGISPHGENV